MTQMKVLMYIFPVMIFFMSKNFPSALPLYWIYSNMFTIVQNYFVYGMYKKTPATAVVSGGNDAGKKAKGANVKPGTVKPGKYAEVIKNSKKAKKPSK